MSHWLETLNAVQMLEQWGLRVSGVALKDPTVRSAGGKTTLDDEKALVDYVESTKGFKDVRPLLRHVYVMGQPPEAYRYINPGETLFLASIRHGQLEGYGRGWETPTLALAALGRFQAALARKIKKEPFVLPVHEDAETDAEAVVSSVESDCQRKHGSRYASGFGWDKGKRKEA